MEVKFDMVVHMPVSKSLNSILKISFKSDPLEFYQKGILIPP